MASEVCSRHDLLQELMLRLVDPRLPPRANNPNLSVQEAVARQMHAVVLLYNYYHRKQQPEVEFLDFVAFCKLCVILRPSMRAFMEFTTKAESTELNDIKDGLSITEKAIRGACNISMALDASKDVPNIEGWPISKVAVLLVDGNKENCLLKFGGVTEGVWSLIEKELDGSNINSKISSEEKVVKKLKINSRRSAAKKNADDNGFMQLAFDAVKELTDINSSDLVVLETHDVYSLSIENTAARFYVMQCSESISENERIPVEEIVMSLQGPLVEKTFGSWTSNSAVEFYHMHPYVGIMSRWLSRKCSSMPSLDGSNSQRTKEITQSRILDVPEIKYINNDSDRVDNLCSTEDDQLELRERNIERIRDGGEVGLALQCSESITNGHNVSSKSANQALDKAFQPGEDHCESQQKWQMRLSGTFSAKSENQAQDKAFQPGEDHCESQQKKQMRLSDTFVSSKSENQAQDVAFQPGEDHCESQQKLQKRLSDNSLSSKSENQAQDKAFQSGEDQFESQQKQQKRLSDYSLSSKSENQAQDKTFQTGEDHCESQQKQQKRLSDNSLSSKSENQAQEKAFQPGEDHCESQQKEQIRSSDIFIPKKSEQFIAHAILKETQEESIQPYFSTLAPFADEVASDVPDAIVCDYNKQGDAPVEDVSLSEAVPSSSTSMPMAAGQVPFERSNCVDQQFQQEVRDRLTALERLPFERSNCVDQQFQQEVRDRLTAIERLPIERSNCVDQQYQQEVRDRLAAIERLPFEMSNSIDQEFKQEVRDRLTAIERLPIERSNCIDQQFQQEVRDRLAAIERLPFEMSNSVDPEFQQEIRDRLFALEQLPFERSNCVDQQFKQEVRDRLTVIERLPIEMSNCIDQWFQQARDRLTAIDQHLEILDAKFTSLGQHFTDSIDGFQQSLTHIELYCKEEYQHFDAKITSLGQSFKDTVDGIQQKLNRIELYSKKEFQHFDTKFDTVIGMLQSPIDQHLEILDAKFTSLGQHFTDSIDGFQQSLTHVEVYCKEEYQHFDAKITSLGQSFKDTVDGIQQNLNRNELYSKKEYQHFDTKFDTVIGMLQSSIDQHLEILDAKFTSLGQHFTDSIDGFQQCLTHVELYCKEEYQHFDVKITSLGQSFNDTAEAIQQNLNRMELYGKKEFQYFDTKFDTVIGMLQSSINMQQPGPEFKQAELSEKVGGFKRPGEFQQAGEFEQVGDIGAGPSYTPSSVIFSSDSQFNTDIGPEVGLVSKGRGRAKKKSKILRSSYTNPDRLVRPALDTFNILREINPAKELSFQSWYQSAKDT
ncbi:uncharacterized protein Fot_50464 [Forsythia ovata]|uniref:VWFA domain-containing protein n=1 Tax=Forsythia ovata TaxID=205694 RepID=A0ABD1PY75_9LAMI